MAVQVDEADPGREAARFRAYLAAVARRLTLARLLRRTAAPAVGLGALVLLLLAIDRPGVLPIPLAVWPLLGGAGLVGLGVAVRRSLARPEEAARYLDHRLGLPETASAGLLLPDAGRLAGRIAGRARVIREGHPARRAVPLLPPVDRGLVAALCLLAFTVPVAIAALLAPPSPGEEAGRRLSSNLRTLEEAGRAGATGEGAGETPDELVEEARRIASRLEQGADPAGAAADLADLEENLARRREMALRAAFVLREGEDAGSRGEDPARTPEERDALRALADQEADPELARAARSHLGEEDGLSPRRAREILRRESDRLRSGLLERLEAAVRSTRDRLDEPPSAPADRPSTDPAPRDRPPERTAGGEGPDARSAAIPPAYREIVRRYFDRSGPGDQPGSGSPAGVR